MKHKTLLVYVPRLDGGCEDVGHIELDGHTLVSDERLWDLEAAEQDALEQARLNGMGSEREAALMAKLEATEKTNREWLRANAPGGWIDNLRVENEALRAEVIHIKEVEFPRKAQAVADGWRGKCDSLRAKIEAMEKQEPVAEMVDDDFGKQIKGINYWWRLQNGAKLYALPGAKGE